ncbi:lysophospholipid acyltransferase family protein [Roseateles sp. SL47]|jgi:1-acyl-sn-glycerol-3-phosphate acyltransferase|uniref:lysophospholipid acyltransferase family protein n=1 Tax=Roseateles sp. SL47 TaxID=2995138 RepID=UPI00226F610F|nr:lysophospholipid acyltransferase family protein [Roseateles sp. SL47]WAC74901.1 lysophospholipid acyltransferase family protein [Roseateles sp. SL47]
MRAVVAAGRVARMVAHIVHGLWIVNTRWKGLDAAERHRYVGWWSAKLLRVLGVGLDAAITPQTTARLITANHISWLDIAAMHAVLPQARFVSKSDIKHWPLVGGLATAVGTLYIERASKRDALRVVHQTAEALQRGETVAVFPEGTTGAGYPLLPLHANLLQAAISVNAPLQPVVLRWYQPGHPYSPAASYIGQMTLMQSLWRILTARDLSVRVETLPLIETHGQERRALAEVLSQRLSAALPKP